MTTRVRWFDRRWTFDFPVENHEDVLERLRGTPARLEERFAGSTPHQRTRREGETWSAQENAGHLLDVEDLWIARTSELLAGATELRAADPQSSGRFGAELSARDTFAVHERPVGAAEIDDLPSLRRLSQLDVLGAHSTVGEDDRVGVGAADANRLRKATNVGTAARGDVYLARHVFPGPGYNTLEGATRYDLTHAEGVTSSARRQ